jgi:ubiquinone/menaquinone biosynthesis C-methylase UbiE
MNERDRVFGESVAEIYERCMAPMLFEAYAADLASRVGAGGRDVLEIGAGTGVLTRALIAALPPDTAITAIDLNQAMLDRAAAADTARRVEWRRADAAELPFPDRSFDSVVCQFTAMFFPDKRRVYGEVRRVLRPGGRFLFNVWDRLADNEFAEVVDTALASLFPKDPPHFMARTPHGYYDLDAIAADLRAAGFTDPPRVDTRALVSRAGSAPLAAAGFCQGTPLRLEIEARDPGGLQRATSVAAEALAARFGAGAIEGRMQAHVFVVRA